MSHPAHTKQYIISETQLKTLEYMTILLSESRARLPLIVNQSVHKDFRCIQSGLESLHAFIKTQPLPEIEPGD